MQNCSSKFKIDIRQRTYKYALAVIRLIEEIRTDQISQVLMKQLLTSATSVGANIIEAQASSSRRDFTNYINHSLKSANESRFWLLLIRDGGMADLTAIGPVIDETCQICNILASSIITLKKK